MTIFLLFQGIHLHLSGILSSNLHTELMDVREVYEPCSGSASICLPVEAGVTVSSSFRLMANFCFLLVKSKLINALIVDVEFVGET